MWNRVQDLKIRVSAGVSRAWAFGFGLHVFCVLSLRCRVVEPYLGGVLKIIRSLGLGFLQSISEQFMFLLPRQDSSQTQCNLLRRDHNPKRCCRPGLQDETLPDPTVEYIPLLYCNGVVDGSI